MNRRKFLGLAGAAAAVTALSASPAEARKAQTGGKAAAAAKKNEEFVAVLVDTTRCIGCRECEVACAEAHGLPVPVPAKDGALAAHRDTSTDHWTVVNRFETDKGTVFVKKQCMHCGQPACAAACPTNAMEKTHEGPVIWHGDRCMGCRYCMMACPFDIPKFEYNSPNPRIRKCIMCYDRLQEGKLPACVEACPKDALTFGTKKELMEIARERIYNNPDEYVHHIYGEFEAGGTDWLYLSAAPFTQIGFREDLGTDTYPDYTREFLYSVPLVFLGFPPLLYGLSELTKRTGEGSEGGEG